MITMIGRAMLVKSENMPLPSHGILEHLVDVVYFSCLQPPLTGISFSQGSDRSSWSRVWSESQWVGLGGLGGHRSGPRLILPQRFLKAVIKCYQWVDVRDNLQETIDFPMKYGSWWWCHHDCFLEFDARIWCWNVFQRSETISWLGATIWRLRMLGTMNQESSQSVSSLYNPDILEVSTSNI